MGYDEVVASLGNFGKYQRRVYLLLCLPAISCALHKLSGVFLQATPDHRCFIDGIDRENSTYSTDFRMELVYPIDELNGKFSSCDRYDLNITEEYLASDEGPPTVATVPCERWIFNTTVYKSSAVMEWNLVCSRSVIKTISDSGLMLGVMLGSIIFGDLSDRLGRRPVFFVSLVLQVIFGVAMAIAPAMWAFAFFRLVVGATTSGVFLVAYVLALEMVGGKWRTFAGVAVQMFFSMGFLVVAGFAYFIDNWRWLQIALTLPGIAFLCYWWFIPESVRWLLTKGRYQEAREILAKAADENGKELDKLLVDDLVAQTEADSKSTKDDGKGKPSILDLFRFPNLRKKTFIIFFLWFVNSGAYYGLSWNTSDLGGNDYITFIISGLVELPAYIFIIIFLNHWGRKVILNGSMIAGGVCLLATIVVQDLTWARIVLAMGGKMAITASYGTVYIFSAEQFPTVIRNVAIGASSTVARFGGILAPSINWTSNIWKPLPLVIYGALALSGGLAALILPETLNRSLPDTIAEGENFGKTMKQVLSDSEMKTHKDDKEALSS